MKLQELDAQRQTKQIARVLESHLGRKIDFGLIGPGRANGMLAQVRGLLHEHRVSTNFHTSEKSPAYLQLVMMEQALSSHIAEMAPAPIAIDMNNPKTKQTMQKASTGQNLNPEEQKTMTAIALMKKEAAKPRRMVKESELQQAQVVLAAQDMIDRIQKMMEEISEMQFKDLPALTDSIKQDMGVDQATQFQAAASQALTTMLQATQAGKTEMEAAQGVITGTAPTIPGTTPELDAAGGEFPTPAGDADIGADLDIDANVDVDGEDEEEDITATLGRDRR
jgi:urease gamma subunit